MTDSVALAPLVAALGEQLCKKNLTIAVAESCTAGLLAAALAELPEASTHFHGGIVAYTPDAKVRLLRVPAEAADEFGVISAEMALKMAAGARHALAADLAVGVTGVSGPSTEEGKPVGLTYVGGVFGQTAVSRELRFNGGRASNRLAAVEAALELALDLVTGHS